MTTSNYTTLLGLALPTTGDLSGQWGNEVNDYISKYVDSSVAGTQTISGSQTAVTLSRANGVPLSQAGSSSTGSSQYQVINCTGNPAGTLTVTIDVTTGTPTLSNSTYSQTFAVINGTSTSQSVVVRATTTSGTSTGVTLVSGEKALIAWNGSDFIKVATSTADGVTTLSFGSTGLTPSTATSGAVTVAGTLVAANGGTGQSSYTTGDLLYATGSTALSKLGIGTNGQVLTSTGTAPQWSTLSGVAVTTFSAGTTGFTPSSATSGAVTLAGTLATTNGGTGLTSFTANGVVYASSTSALTTGSALTFNGTDLVSGAGIRANSYMEIRSNTAALYWENAANTLYWSQNLTGSDFTWNYFNGTSLAEQMRLTTTGLGIGTSSPAAKLQSNVSRTSGQNVTALVLSDTVTGAQTSGFGTQIQGWSNNGSAQSAIGFEAYGGTNNDTALGFYTQSSAGGLTRRMTISSTGDVGIGTGSPSQKLEVAGNILINTGGNPTMTVKTSGAGNNPGYLLTADTNTWGIYGVFSDANDTLQYQYNGTSRLTLTNDGNLGLGVTPSGYLANKFVINTGTDSNNGITIASATNRNGSIWFADGTTGDQAYRGGVDYQHTTDTLYLYSGGLGNFQLTAAGNIGLGVTPSAWNANNKSIIQLQNTANLFTRSTGLYATSNVVYNSADTGVFQANGYGLMYQQNQTAGTHVWLNTPNNTSGAGATASLTSAMTLDANGSLLIGSTGTPTASAKVKIKTPSRTGTFFDLDATGGENWIIDSTNTVSSTDVLGIYAYGATGLYIQDNGNVGIGTSSPSGNGRLELNVPSGNNTNLTFYENGASRWLIGSVTGSNAFRFYDLANATERFQIAATGAWGLAGANYGTAGQVLTSNGSGSAPTWQNAGGGGGSAATPTALGTVYGLTQDTSGNANTVLGYQSLNANTTGSSNIAMGVRALYSNTSGARITALGYNALYNSTTSSDNTAVGSLALLSNTTGSLNTAVGSDALRNNTTASNNIAVGYQSLYTNTTGASNVAVGVYAGYYTTTGNYNVFVGSRSTFYNAGAGQNNTTGTDNTAVGGAALRANTTGSQNVALGSEALVNNTTANNNTAVGFQALSANSTTSGHVAIGAGALKSLATGAVNSLAIGQNALTNFNPSSNATNTAVGGSALSACTTGAGNVALGRLALTALTSGQVNIAIGSDDGIGNWVAPLRSLTTGSSNVAIGPNALQALTTGGKNIGIGERALQNATTPSNNIAIGCVGGNIGNGPLQNCTTGAINVAIGGEALASLTTANGNTAVGYGSMAFATTAPNNTALGVSTLIQTTTGEANTAVGYQALQSNTTAGYSTAVGYQALYTSNRTADTTGSNTAVGYQAGHAITTGQKNVCIGVLASSYNTSLTTGSNNVYIGVRPGCSAATVSNELVISSVESDGKGGSTGFINPNGGGVYQGNNSSSWSTTSDFRLKKNIVDNNEGIDIISQIRVRNFEYRLPEEVTELPAHTVIKKAGIQLGVIAQELQQVCPDCVKEESTGVLSVDSDNVFWHMVNAIKQLKAEVDSLKAQINQGA